MITASHGNRLTWGLSLLCVTTALAGVDYRGTVRGLRANHCPAGRQPSTHHSWNRVKQPETHLLTISLRGIGPSFAKTFLISLALNGEKLLQFDASSSLFISLSPNKSAINLPCRTQPPGPA